MPEEVEKNDGYKAVIQHIDEHTLTLNIGGEVRKIQNQLAELKGLMQNLEVGTVQYAEKIYNIEHINEANFGFVTGKKAFNESLTKQLIEAIQPHSPSAREFLRRVAHISNWESELRISDKANEIVAYSMVGVIGVQLSKLLAIGKEDLSESKQDDYIQQCQEIARQSLDLICFVLLSALWDAQKQQPRLFSEAQRKALAMRFDRSFQSSITEQFRLLQTLYTIFSDPEHGLSFPILELQELAESIFEGSACRQVVQNLDALDDKLNQLQCNLVDCYEAETQLAAFFQHFHFLANYRMVSIKHISYEQLRNADPHYLHRFAALGIDSKANVNAEKINYTPQTAYTNAVLFYQGDNYQKSINLFPFVIDYNALTFEHGAKVCFFRSREIGNDDLEFLFLEDNSLVHLENKSLFKSDRDYNELMMSDENRKILNLNSVVECFRDARRCLIGEEELNLDDL